MEETVKEFLARIGKKGGATRGVQKARGDSAYYRKLAQKAVKSRKRK